MTKVAIDISRHYNNDGEDDSTDRWRYRGSYSGNINRIYIAKKDYDYSYNGLETDLEPPFYVVYCEYYTGDTFGSDYEASLIHAYEDEDDAIALVRTAREFKGYGTLPGTEFYVPWNGYFETLISVDYERVT